MKGIKRKKARMFLKERCAYCWTNQELTIDHKHPLIKGGTNSFKNLQRLCKRCNSLKSDIPDGRLRNIWRWFLDINYEREVRGKKPILGKYKAGNLTKVLSPAPVLPTLHK